MKIFSLISEGSSNGIHLTIVGCRKCPDHHLRSTNSAGAKNVLVLIGFVPYRVPYDSVPFKRNLNWSNARPNWSRTHLILKISYSSLFPFSQDFECCETQRSWSTTVPFSEKKGFMKNKNALSLYVLAEKKTAWNFRKTYMYVAGSLKDTGAW